ncbi:DUF748 domain-containing protein [Salinicola lusitanus]|uniref:DUF748 domain-containing protein n=1 Tax=Salinicola lusitanus TaxID=1949085 RepID=UPI000DA257E7|nr:DUF748 domain-containing protein [Salinicola lusitanus]
MFNSTRGLRAGVFCLVVVLAFTVCVVGPWALTKWAESRFTRSLGEPVRIERVSFNPFTATAAFSTLRIGDSDTPMISVDSGEVVFSWSTLWHPGIHISAVRLDSPRLHLISPPSGPLNLATLGSRSSSRDTASHDGSSLTIDRIEASHGRIDWQGRRVSGEPSLAATEVSVTLTGYQRSGDSPMQGQASGKLGGGQVDLEGRFGIMPLTGDLAVTAQRLAASTIDPWLTAAMPARIDEGRVDLDGQLRFGAAASASVAYRGQVTLEGLSTVGQQDQPLFSLDRGVFKGVDYATGDHLVIDSSHLAAPTLTALIGDDGRFNLAASFAGGQDSHSTANPNDDERESGTHASRREGGDAGAAPRGDDSSDQGENGSGEKVQAKGPAVALHRLEVEGGTFDFEDRRMSPTVSLDVGELNGQLTRLDTRSDEPAHYRFDGRESDGTPVVIEGSASLGDAPGGRMRLTTQHLALSLFAPYIQRFAGYRIEQGTADLELNYRLQGGTLTAQNHIILKQLDLGKEIDEDATSLPLKNLIGLLQAETGVINLDIPIETTIDGNTQVDMSKVVWQALTESLSNIVTSPIDSLQALIGGDG